MRAIRKNGGIEFAAFSAENAKVIRPYLPTTRYALLEVDSVYLLRMWPCESTNPKQAIRSLYVLCGAIFELEGKTR